MRGLVMSYFDFYFNILGQKTLRSYSNPVDLTRFDGQDWMTTSENLDYIGDYLNTVKHHEVLAARHRKCLNHAENDLVALCFNGAVADGVYQPE
jgi:hypothetical protein